MSSTPTVSRTKVDLSGLMEVLGRHLYSTPTVALRELVQNAHDSCHRRRIESPLPFEPRVTVRTNPSRRTLSIEDTGAGLTAQEIEAYLATVGAGYTRTLREKDQDAGLIGYFGLGFLSAFIIAERTVVHTCSYQEPDTAWMFSSRAGQSYTVIPAEPRPVGTEVTLHLAERFAELAEMELVQSLIERYCCLLEFPVHCGALGPVNGEPPPWRDTQERSPLRKRKLALDFARRFEPSFAPLFCLPVAPKPGADATAKPPCRGLIWIQDASTYGTSDNRRVWVFVRGMMVTDNDRELLPPWAGFAGAVVESEVLAPTASRESLQKNDDYREAAVLLSESLIAGLADIAKHEPEAWQRMLVRHNEALLGAALSDERLFTLLADDVTVPTSQGDLTMPRILALSGGKVHVTQGEGGGFEELLFRALKVPVVRGSRYAALPFCRLYTEQIRGSLILLGAGGDTAMFHPAALAPEEEAKLRAWFAAEDVQVVLARFEPDYLPLILVPDREVELKRRIESDQAHESIANAALSLARMFTSQITNTAAARLYINVACPAISALFRAEPKQRERGLALLRSFVSFTAEPERQSVFMDVDEALRRFSDTIAMVLQEG